MADTLADFFVSGDLWIKSSKHNYDLNKFGRVDFAPENFGQNSKIEQLVNKFFNTSVNGLRLERDNFYKNKKYIIEFEEKNTPHEFQISIINLKDDYFIVDVRYPLIQKEVPFGTFNSNQISITEDRYLIDGIDGFEHWAEELQINKEGIDFFDILFLPIPKKESMDVINRGHGYIREIKEKYPYYYIAVTDVNHGYYYFFTKNANNNFIPYGMSYKNQETFYIYKSQEEKDTLKRWKKEYDRLYNIYHDIRYNQNSKGNLTEDEISYLITNLRNPSFRNSIEETSANFKDEQTYQKCLELVNKLQTTANKNESHGLRYLYKFNRYFS